MLLINTPNQFMRAKIATVVMRIKDKRENSLDAIFFVNENTRVFLMKQPLRKAIDSFRIVADLFFVRSFKQVLSTQLSDARNIQALRHTNIERTDHTSCTQAFPFHVNTCDVSVSNAIEPSVKFTVNKASRCVCVTLYAFGLVACAVTSD